MNLNSEKIENLLEIIEVFSKFDEKVIKTASSILKDRETSLALANLLEHFLNQEYQELTEEKIYKDEIIDELNLEKIKSNELTYLIEKTLNINVRKLNKDDKIQKIKFYIKNSSVEQGENFKENAIKILNNRKMEEKKESTNDLMKWSNIIIKKDEELD